MSMVQVINFYKLVHVCNKFSTFVVTHVEKGTIFRAAIGYFATAFAHFALSLSRARPFCIVSYTSTAILNRFHLELLGHGLAKFNVPLIKHGYIRSYLKYMN